MAHNRLNDAGALLTWLVSRGGQNGAPVTRHDMANGLGWSPRRLDNTVRWLREHPEHGYAVTMRRGSQPMVYVSTPTDLLPGTSLRPESLMARMAVLMHYWQIARACAGEFVHYENKDNPTVAPGDRAVARRRRNEHRTQLVLIQSAMDRTRSEENELWEYIDDVLNI